MLCIGQRWFLDIAKLGIWLFDKMSVKNLVAWTKIIYGYAEKGLENDAIGLYNKMEAAGLKLDDRTIVSILAACAESDLPGLGKRVQFSMERSRYNTSVLLMCPMLWLICMQNVATLTGH
ncbi:hypothetical protein ACSBR2_024779 [Camellia fascicularis]